jgi:outer membrane protein TolC
MAVCSLFAGKGLAQDTTQVGRLRTLLTASSPALAALRADTAAAGARASATGFAPPATIALEVEEIPGGVDVTDAGSIRLEVNREFLTGGRRTARRNAARIEAEAANLALSAGERQLQARIEHALLRAIGTSMVVRRLAAEDSLLSLAEQALRTRFEVGDARYIDVLRLRTERLRIQADRAASAAATRAARQHLLALGGSALGDPARAPDSIVILVDSVVSQPSHELFEAPLAPAPSLDSLLQFAAALRRADLAVRSAQAAQRVELAEQGPVLTLGLGVQRFGTEAGEHELGPTLGVGFSLPFTAARANRLGRLAADLGIAAAEAARIATDAAVRGELLVARERYEAQRERLALYDRALLQGAREERETALTAYRNGELPLIELLDFERALAQGELDMVRTRIAAAAALAELFGGASVADTDLIPPPSAEAIP